MAYMLQQPEGQIPQYYMRLLASMKWKYSKKHNVYTYMRKTKAADFTRAAAGMSSFLYKKWGIKGGELTHTTVSRVPQKKR